MIKYLTILLLGMTFLCLPVYAEEQTESVDEDSRHAVDHGNHSMNNDDDIDHGDHEGHDMGHDDGHGMVHGDDHMMDESIPHEMDHSSAEGHSAHHGDGHHHMDTSHIMDHEGGMIMGQNFDELPSSCDRISEEIEITVRAGRKYAEKFPGTAFAFDNQQWRVTPCAKVTWHFINEDEVRHQFMMHGLPKYLYKNGMFHLEVTGPRTISGTMIVPATDATYLVHCDISQHMEKGMKAQLVVGEGGDDIPSIPGLTPYTFTDTYTHEALPQVSDQSSADSITQQITDFIKINSPIYGMMILGLLVGLLSTFLIVRFTQPKK